MALTHLDVIGAKARDKQFKLADSKGLYLVVTTQGSKLWRMDYRFDGKRGTLSFGKFPAVSLADARKKRDAARDLIAHGTNPATGKQEIDAAAEPPPPAPLHTFSEAFEEWFERRLPRWTSRYAAFVRSRIEADVIPEIGHLDVGAIEPPRILEVVRKMEARGIVDLTHRVKNHCGEIFQLAIAEGRAKRDPTADIRAAMTSRPPKKRRAAVPSIDMGNFLVDLDRYDGDAVTRLALRFLILTMVRTTEVRFMRQVEFEHLDGASPLWRIPAERMKMRSPHLVPLSTQAVETLRQLVAITKTSNQVLAAPTRSGVMSENTMLYALYRMGYHQRATVHGFRGVASTVLNEQGFNRDWVELQLAHVERDEVRGAYNAAEYLSGRREMLQWWADWLDQQELLARVVG